MNKSPVRAMGTPWYTLENYGRGGCMAGLLGLTACQVDDWPAGGVAAPRGVGDAQPGHIGPQLLARHLPARGVLKGRAVLNRYLPHT